MPKMHQNTEIEGGEYVLWCSVAFRLTGYVVRDRRVL